MWYGLAEGNATGQNRPRGRPRTRQPGATPTAGPQKPLTLSKPLEIQTQLATQGEKPLQVESSAGALRRRSTWCQADSWDLLGR
ncbi:hypothetical protein MTO96_038340 [Rhipicephalus appendiculatus]